MRIDRLGLSALAVTALLGTGVAVAHDGAHDRVRTDQAHDRFLPAYARGRLVAYEFRGGAPTDATSRETRTLFEVEYPTGWPDLVAHPLCDYCDHGGNGEDAYDYHDHVLAGLPGPAENARGRVFWHVTHVSPAYTGDATHDSALTAAYAEQLPATSASAVERLLRSALPDGSPLATATDTGFAFSAPLSRR